tara:strand:- start:157161 stop:157628 length:468 start_codon:yes stop_codon:yes gene_type:complete
MAFKIMFNTMDGQTRTCEWDKDLDILSGLDPYWQIDTEISFEDFDRFNQDFGPRKPRKLAQRSKGMDFSPIYADIVEQGSVYKAVWGLKKDPNVCTFKLREGGQPVMTYIDKSVVELIEIFNKESQSGELCCDIRGFSGREPFNRKIFTALKQML